MWKPLVVAALELGTTYSGLAYSLMHKLNEDPLDIEICYIWDYPCFRPGKTPTCLLLDKERKYVAFGYDAEYRYAELVDYEEQDDYYFFDCFTMGLHNNEVFHNVTRDMVLKDKTGKQCSSVEVFKLSIKALADRMMKILERVFMHDEVLWVLTVPAAWTDSAKQLMRESAEKAGINPEKLLLVNEPEAAFTYCHYLPTTRLQGSKPGHMIKDPGTKSMVVDLGDMTADITVLQQTYNGKLKVLYRATGDDCGGASVDDRFCKMLEEIFGGNVTTLSNRKYPIEWLDMRREFRTAIEGITKSKTEVLVLKFPSSLNAICEELHAKDLKSVIKSSLHVNEVTQVADKFRFKADLIIKLVTPTIDSIITLMKNTVSDRSTNGVSNNVSNIVMVGGLSECPMIQEAVYKAFPDNQIIIPVNVDLSVLKGAVLFGHRPDYNMSELFDEEGIGK